jgi:capsular polysaccharide biosynthesis protein
MSFFTSLEPELKKLVNIETIKCLHQSLLVNKHFQDAGYVLEILKQYGMKQTIVTLILKSIYSQFKKLSKKTLLMKFCY